MGLWAPESRQRVYQHVLQENGMSSQWQSLGGVGKVKEF